MLSQSEFYHKSAPLKSDEKNDKFTSSELGDLQQLDNLLKFQSDKKNKGISSVEVEHSIDNMINKTEEV